MSYPITAMLAVVMRSVFRGGRYSLKIKFDVLFYFIFLLTKLQLMILNVFSYLLVEKVNDSVQISAL